MRIHRDDEKFLRSVGDDFAHDVGHRGFPVAHGQMHRHVDLGREKIALLLARDNERRTRFGPDGGVGRGAFARAERQDEKIEHDGPQDRVHIEHATVGKELTQVASDVRDFGRVRGAEIEK